MSKEELEIRRIKVEIDKISAETLESHRRRRWAGVTDAVRVVGGALAMVVGLWAAATTYEITQLRTRLALSDKNQAEKELAAAVKARDTAVSARARAESETKAVEHDLVAAQAKIEAARAEIAELEALRQTAETLASLRRVSGNLEAASKHTSRTIPHILLVPATAEDGLPASQVADELSAQGFGVSVFPHLNDIRLAPVTTEVRFYRREDDDEAIRIASLLTRIGSMTAMTSFVAEPAGRRRPRSFEIRFAANLKRRLPPALFQARRQLELRRHKPNRP